MSNILKNRILFFKYENLLDEKILKFFLILRIVFCHSFCHLFIQPLIFKILFSVSRLYNSNIVFRKALYSRNLPYHMVLANQTSVRGSDYVDVLKQAGLHEAFERAWDCDLTDHSRTEQGLGSVSEDVLIEKTLEEAEDLWGFTMNISNASVPIYHLIPFQQNVSDSETQKQEFTTVPTSALQDIDDAVETVRESRPDDPELVSYALDDIQTTLHDIDF